MSSRLPLKIPKVYEGLLRVPVKHNANIVLHGFPGGDRHIPVDLKTSLERTEGLVVSVDENSIYITDGNGELHDYHGETLREALCEAKGEFPQLLPLYRVTGKDPIDETECYIAGAGLKRTAEEYLFGGDIPDEETLDRLTVSRFYRAAMGRPLDERTKWSQGGRFGDGYVAFKFDVHTTEDVYHPGAGNRFGQTFRGIHTTGKIRCTDPQRDPAQVIEMSPPEKVCVSDCSYGDDLGMTNIAYFYPFYDNWRKQGKQVYFKADMHDPPKFPHEVHVETRPHNSEYMAYTGPEVSGFPDLVAMRRNMSRANVARNIRTRDQEINWPAYDKERVEMLLCGDCEYDMQIPKRVDLSKTIMDKARFPITRKQFRDRAMIKTRARPFNRIAASILVFLMSKLKGIDEGPVEIDLLAYPFFSNHSFVEEPLWGFEECGQRIGLEREKTKLIGHMTGKDKQAFLRLVEKHVATR